jgi:hypothetical protein
MDLQKRQELLNAVTLAASENAFVGLQCRDGGLILARRDLICHETHVELTDAEGSSISINYPEIDHVDVVIPENQPINREKGP